MLVNTNGADPLVNDSRSPLDIVNKVIKYSSSMNYSGTMAASSLGTATYTMHSDEHSNWTCLCWNLRVVLSNNVPCK